jgi:RimJ/RimL family protein N-acetyltransferase
METDMFIRTDRLLLRPGWHEERHELARLLGDAAVARNLARAPHPYGADDAAAFIAEAEGGDLPQLLMFNRTLGGQPRLVGGVGLHRGEGGLPYLGYWVGRAYWGLGLATEGASALLSAARDSLRIPSVGAWHFCDNPASGHVLEKLGFCHTGHIAARPSLAREGLSLARGYRLDLIRHQAGPVPAMAA